MSTCSDYKNLVSREKQFQKPPRYGNEYATDRQRDVELGCLPRCNDGGESARTESKETPPDLTLPVWRAWAWRD
jgi:hypothetical protein